VKATYIQQEAPLGLAHAVKTSQHFLKDDSFVMFLGDNLIKDGIVSLVNEFRDESPNSQILLARVPNPSDFGVAEIVNGKVVRLEEKPKTPKSDYALVGVYMFDPTIFEAVHAIRPSARGELEITDAIQWLIDQGHMVEHDTLDGWWIDTGKKDPLLHCNRLVLDTIEHRVDGHVDAQSRVERRVVIEEGAQLISSVVRGPAIIGARTRLVDTYVGPYTSIAADCELIDTEIEHSVVLDHSRIQGVHRISDSLLGREVEVERSGTRPRATRLVLGDHSRADLE